MTVRNRTLLPAPKGQIVANDRVMCVAGDEEEPAQIKLQAAPVERKPQ